jgi:uncharacterized OB-fold protein
MSALQEALDHQPENQKFWTGLAEGRFLLKYCTACQRAHWYPRAICPHCASSQTEWRPASGRGRIYSFSISRTASPPYVIAYVTLDEGPTMMTRIVHSPFEALAIGKPVELVIEKGEDGIPLPLFQLA